MNSIVIPNEYYDFSNLHLATPISIQGGAFFTKLLNNNDDVFIQTPKSTTKQGFIKSGKKIHCDLMFDKTNGDFIEWLENLENKIVNLINHKSNAWFQDEIEKDDIENAFASPVKVYKSGNYYLVRCYVESPRMAQSSNQLTIFDESENEVSMENVNEDSNIISILQIHGVKFTPKSFQIYIQIKQVMMLSNTLFKKCIIKHNSSSGSSSSGSSGSSGSSSNINILNTLEKDNTNKNEVVIQKDLDNNIDSELNDEKVDFSNTLEDLENNKKDNKENAVDLKEISREKENNLEEKMNEEEIEEMEVSEEEKKEDLKELEESINEKKECEKDAKKESVLEEYDIDINLDNLETISLKKPEKIYYDIYLKAKEKAKSARKKALEAYLELKEIKSNYMIDDIDDSDEEMEEINKV